MLTSIYVSDPGPRIGLEQPFYTTTEESGAVQLCVSITQMISGTVTATVTTFSQTAIGWFQQSVVSVELEIFKTFPFSWLWLYIIVYYFNILWWWLTKVCGGTANRRRCGWKSGVFPGCCGKQRSPSLQSSGNCYYISRCRWRIASVKHVYMEQALINCHCYSVQMDSWLWLCKSLLWLWMRERYSYLCVLISSAPPSATQSLSHLPPSLELQLVQQYS